MRQLSDWNSREAKVTFLHHATHDISFLAAAVISRRLMIPQSNQKRDRVTAIFNFFSDGIQQKAVSESVSSLGRSDGCGPPRRERFVHLHDVRWGVPGQKRRLAEIRPRFCPPRLFERERREGPFFNPAVYNSFGQSSQLHCREGFLHFSP